jgi:acyl carrier protein
MSVQAVVISEIQQIADDDKKILPPLTDDLVLLDSGLDSLALAILVVRLEETLGCDPFTESNDTAYPVTLGDFIRFYEHAFDEHAAGCPDVDSRQAG